MNDGPNYCSPGTGFGALCAFLREKRAASKRVFITAEFESFP